VLRVGDVRVELGHAPILELLLQPCRGALTSGIGRVLAERARAARRPGPFDGELERILAGARATGDVAALGGLVGLGEGLTPSGDDLLVGILAGGLLASAQRPAAAWRRALDGVLRPRLALGSPRLSRQLIEAALEGAFAEPLLALGEALTATDAARLESAAHDLLALGHRSGADLLWGLGVGLDWAEGP
jgi:hypothetical protein